MVGKGLLEPETDERGVNEGKVLLLEGTQQEASLAEEGAPLLRVRNVEVQTRYTTTRLLEKSWLLRIGFQTSLGEILLA